MCARVNACPKVCILLMIHRFVICWRCLIVDGRLVSEGKSLLQQPTGSGYIWCALSLFPPTCGADAKTHRRRVFIVRPFLSSRVLRLVTLFQGLDLHKDVTGPRLLLGAVAHLFSGQLPTGKHWESYLLKQTS